MRRRVCYKNHRQPKKGDDVDKIRQVLEHDVEWVPFYEFNGTGWERLKQRIFLLFSLNFSLLTIFFDVEVFIGNMSRYALLINILALLFGLFFWRGWIGAQNTIIELAIDEQHFFVRAKYLNWLTSTKSHFLAAESLNLAGSGALLDAKKAANLRHKLILKDGKWTGLVPTCNYSIKASDKAQIVFGTFHLNE